MKNFIYTVFVLGFVAIFNIASAHVKVVKTSPVSGETLESSPSSLTISYSKNVRLVSIKLSHTDGGEISLDYKLTYAPTAEFVIPVPELKPGKYKAEWVIMGTDSHKMNSSLSFEVLSSKEL